MRRTAWSALLERTCALAIEYLERIPERPVGPRQGPGELLAAFDRPVPDAPAEVLDVVEELVRTADPGLTTMQSGRFFGWVIGGGVPAAIAADWMTTVWDQNAGSAEGTPAAAAVEQVALRWVAELLDLPAASGALVTGATMASFVGLAVARSAVLRAVGWDVEADGLFGAPPIQVIVGEQRHNTIDKALRLLGLGERRTIVVPADDDGRMRADHLVDALAAARGPTIVCAQAGNVNGGAFDPLPAIGAAVAAARARLPVGAAWLHLDGAFGLWARAAPGRRALAAGAELADSWSTDAHKWLNTPYDCGVALIRDAAAHRRAMRGGAAYLPGDDPVVRSAYDHAPELSRRARGFVVWAALRSLGRQGVAELVERCCRLAARIGDGLAAIPGCEVVNEVALNQLVVRFRDPAGGDDDAHTRAVLQRVIADGVCYPTGTIWRGAAAIRISVSNWTTDDDDVDRTVAAIASAHVRPDAPARR